MDPTKYRIIDEEEQEPLSPAPTQEFATRAVPKLLSEQSETTEYQSTQKKETEIHPVKRQISYPAGEELTDEIDRIYELRRGNADKCPVCYSQKIDLKTSLQDEEIEVPTFPINIIPKKEDELNDFEREEEPKLTAKVTYTFDQTNRCCLDIRVEICCEKMTPPCECKNVMVSIEAKYRDKPKYLQHMPWVRLGVKPSKPYYDTVSWEKGPNEGCHILHYKLCQAKGDFLEKFRIKIGRSPCSTPNNVITVSGAIGSHKEHREMATNGKGYYEGELNPWDTPYPPKMNKEYHFKEGISMFTTELSLMESDCCSCEHLFGDDGYFKGDWLVITKEELDEEGKCCYNFKLVDLPEDVKNCFKNYWVKWRDDTKEHSTWTIYGPFELDYVFKKCLNKGEKASYEVTFDPYAYQRCGVSGVIICSEPCFGDYAFYTEGSYDTEHITFDLSKFCVDCYAKVKFAYQTTKKGGNRHFSIYEIILSGECNCDFKEIFSRIVGLVIDRLRQIERFHREQSRWELLLWKCWRKDGNIYYPCNIEGKYEPCNKYHFDYNGGEGYEWQYIWGLSTRETVIKCPDPCIYESHQWMQHFNPKFED